VSVVHRVRLPLGAVPLVEVGHEVEPAEVLATRRPPGPGATIPIAARLRTTPGEAAERLAVAAGDILETGGTLGSDDRGRTVRAPYALLFLGYDAVEGTALVAPLRGSEPIVGHVRGEVASVAPDAIEIVVAGPLLQGVGGSGSAVHGELRVAVREPGEELRASLVDVGAAGKILVGGSRASAETLTRARAMGAAGIVLGGILEKELRDFESTRQRRRDVGGEDAPFAIVLLEGFGKVGLDPGLFAWLRAQEGRTASLFGEQGRVYVYEAGPPPARRALPRPGDRVLAHRRPHAGAPGELVRVLHGLHATDAGIVARSGVVRFDDGPIAVVPLANLEAVEREPDATAVDSTDD
jgi:hypothetical protein